MIKANITSAYPAHMEACAYSNESLYVADYTKQTRASAIKRGVEIFQGAAPRDIAYFTLQNNVRLLNGFIIFNNASFTRPDGRARSQCECVVFPEASDANSWIFFIELKYGAEPCNNNKNLRQAIMQLYKTRAYYYLSEVFLKTNTCYLLASLPIQAEPFAQAIITQPALLRLKRKHNVVLRLQNHAEVQDDKVIVV
ncbi:MAG: hypothetical protein LBT94_07125 [Prevotellaceae bacterium]|jgi:hypothetical protein|nr:hypothetical protein [Prevotellaceae bacterium]